MHPAAGRPRGSSQVQGGRCNVCTVTVRSARAQICDYDRSTDQHRGRSGTHCEDGSRGSPTPRNGRIAGRCRRDGRQATDRRRAGLSGGDWGLTGRGHRCPADWRARIARLGQHGRLDPYRQVAEVEPVQLRRQEIPLGQYGPRPLPVDRPDEPRPVQRKRVMPFVADQVRGHRIR